MTFAEILAEKGAEAGLSFTPLQLEQFSRYYELLVETNKVMNLTAITEPEEVAVKHMVDSLLAYEAEMAGKTLADVGTGAGFPGVPLKIYCPELKVTLIDSLGKRLRFLQQVIDAVKDEVHHLDRGVYDAQALGHLGEGVAEKLVVQFYDNFLFPSGAVDAFGPHFHAVIERL